MEVAGEEVDNQQAVRGAEVHILMLEIDDLAKRATHDLAKHAGAVSNPIASWEHAGECISDKGKEKVDEKMKKPMFIGGVSLLDLQCH